MAQRIRVTFREGGPEPGHTEIYVAERRPKVKRLLTAGWDDFKEHNTDHRSISIPRYGLEFIHIDRRMEVQLARTKLIKDGKIPNENPDEVKTHLLLQLKWARSALQGYQSSDITAEVIFYDQKTPKGRLIGGFRLHPDGTVEKYEEKYIRGPTTLVPLGNAKVTIHWAALGADDKLTIGETTVNAPAKKMGLK